MNYHLKQLEGLIERNGNRRYHLTPIGKKALTVLSSMTDDLENGYEDYLQNVKPSRGEGFVTWANRWFGLVVIGTFSAFLGLVVFVWSGVIGGNFSEVQYLYLGIIAFVLIILLVWLRGWVRREAERVQGGWESLLDRLTGRFR
jgi:hypothetical protein